MAPSAGLNARTYTAEADPADRISIEEQLISNDVKVVVATSALGMGFDKPDLTFVVHYQSPGSPIAYYQQVGRAGRGVAASMGVLLAGREDVEIQDWFIRTAFPPRTPAERVVSLLEEAASPMTLRDLEATVNVRHTLPRAHAESSRGRGCDRAGGRRVAAYIEAVGLRRRTRGASHCRTKS